MSNCSIINQIALNLCCQYCIVMEKLKNYLNTVESSVYIYKNARDKTKTLITTTKWQALLIYTITEWEEHVFFNFKDIADIEVLYETYIGYRILTSSTRPNPPTPSVAINVISLSSSSAISLGIFRDTVPIFVKFSEDGASL